MAGKKTTEQYAKELLERHNLVLTSEYGGAHSKILFNCKNGHANEGMATNILQRGYACKECIHGVPIAPKIKWEGANASKLLALVESSASLADIAKAFNTSEASITNACQKLGLVRSKLPNSYKVLKESLEVQERELLTTFIQYRGAHQKVRVKCKNEHIVEQSASNIISKGIGCPTCSNINTRSKKEIALANYIISRYSGWVVESDRDILSNSRELDIVVPDLGLAFEFDGDFWHSDSKVGKNYNLSKTEEVEAFGYRLIHIPEHLWDNRQHVVKAKIDNLLQVPSTKLYARKGVVSKLDYFPKQFLDANHLQGSGSPTGINYGIFYEDKLTAVMTFAKPRFTNKYQYELVRFCTLIGTTVVGGASKLLKSFEREYAPKSIISYANRQWSSGDVYSKLGFTHSHNTEPGYAYAKHGIIISRYAAQKHMLASFLKVFDPNLSEYENMLANHYHRIWDCGNQVWVKSHPKA